MFQEQKKIKYCDLVASKLAIRFGILNMPSEQQWKNLESLAKDIIQPIMDKFKGIEITSCFRALELNNQVRGSTHLIIFMDMQWI